MRTFLVVNPSSANGQTGKRWLETSAKLRREIGDFGHAFTSAPMEGAQLASRAIRDGYQSIVAVGGDGTLNEVVNGFFENGKAINPQAALGVIPRGTGGDFRRTFGWGPDLASAVRRLKGDRTVSLDVGALEYTTHSGGSATRYFANICSFGASGLVDRKVSETTRLFGGKACFMLGTMKALLQYKDQKVRLGVDGKPWEEVEATTVAVANGKYFGGGMCVAPEAVSDDGLFDVTVWSGYAFSDFILKAKSLYDGSHVKLPGTRRLRCKTLTASSDEEVLLDVDGEQPGRLPCRSTVLPAAIRLKVEDGGG
jgi:YegS/Rv2252/BmrU family lipid kinase